ncbi:MAG: lysylphosphatidylglycerol synthase transmembrane domain-containing protein [Ferruginibacter sp.]
MNKRLISLLQYLIFLGGGVFLIWWQLRSMTPQETEACKKALQMANYWLVIPVVVISLLSHISRSMRWKLLMKPLDYHPKLSNVFASVMAGYLANAAVPRLGEVLKCTLLARYEKLHFDKLFGSILVERIFDMICYLVFIGITILIQVNAVGNYVRTKFAAMNTQAGVPWWAKLFIMIVLIISFFYFIKFLMRRYPGNKIFYKVNAFLKGVLEGFRTIQNLKERKLFLAHTVFIWSMYLLQIYIGFWAMESTSHLGIKPAFSVLSLATLAMIATPGGIGSFPLFVKETLLIYNIAAPAGIAFGWLLWTANTSFIIVCGLLALGMLPFINKKNNEINTSNTN